MWTDEALAKRESFSIASPKRENKSKEGGASAHTHPLLVLFTALWGLLIGLVFVVEFLWPASTVPQEVTQEARTDAWMMIVLGFLVVELWAVAYGPAGDTLSEQVWAFIHGEISRGAIAMGFMLLFLVRVVELGKEPVGLGGLDFGRLLLALGIAIWLGKHFIERERGRHKEGRGDL